MEQHPRPALRKAIPGWFTLSMGAAWEMFEVSHNLNYIVEVIRRFDFARAAGHIAHAWPVLTIAIGAVWVFLSSKERQVAIRTEQNQGSNDGLSPNCRTLEIRREKEQGPVRSMTVIKWQRWR